MGGRRVIPFYWISKGGAGNIWAVQCLTASLEGGANGGGGAGEEHGN